MWIVVRPSMRIDVLLVPLRMKAASSVNSINGSNGWFITCNKILDAWHCPLGEMGIRRLYACSPYTCSWNTEACTKSSRATLYHFKNAFLFLHILLTCSFRWNMSNGKHASNVLNTLENTQRSAILRIGNRRWYSSTIAVAPPSQKP